MGSRTPMGRRWQTAIVAVTACIVGLFLVYDALGIRETVPSEAPSSSSNPSSSNQPLTSAAASTLIPIANQFTVVMLSYKSPLSLRATLRSLVDSELTAHPAFFEVLVYFQMRRAEDDALVAEVLPHTQFRVIGDARNIPVAQATAEAVNSARTGLILYLECDRPVFPFGGPNHQLTVADVTRFKLATQSTLSLAVSYVSTQQADLFRLQLYSSADYLGDAAMRGILPHNTYGSDPHTHCQRAALYNTPPAPSSTSQQEGVCLRSKGAVRAAFGQVFHTAYCKHWAKLQLSPQEQKSGIARPQSDMCDSFCFAEWAAWKRPPQRISHRNVTIDGSIICLTSEDCNWTNQPTLYKRRWYLDQIAAPCLRSPEYCVGRPGRMSAVRQEQFYIKHPQHWAQHRYRICLTSGIFYHNEVDNRE